MISKYNIFWVCIIIGLFLNILNIRVYIKKVSHPQLIGSSGIPFGTVLPYILAGIFLPAVWYYKLIIPLVFIFLDTFCIGFVLAIYQGFFNGRNKLHIAVMRNKYNDVKRILSSGIDINSKDNQGTTALSIAFENGNKRMLDLLLENGADPYAKDGFNKDLFSLEMHEEYKPMIDYLRNRLKENN